VIKHRFLVPADRIQADAVSFSTEQWHQLHVVLRLRIGDRVGVFDGIAPFDHVVEIVGSGLGRVLDRRRQASEPRTCLVVYPSLLQRDKFEVVLQKLTETGVAAIVPVLTSRTIVREAPDEKRQVRWRAILREAAEQCGRGVVPELLPALPFSQAIERASAESTVVMACEGERRRTLAEALAGARPIVSLFVGPEGGFAPEEVEQAQAAGVRLTTLGPRILRSETASPLLAALVLYELGDLSSADDDERP
jgi:16S rRNA (uracil1498-N3)-methyltransferase